MATEAAVMTRLTSLEGSLAEVKALLEAGTFQSPGQPAVQTLSYTGLVDKTDSLESSSQVTRSTVEAAVNKIEEALSAQASAISQAKTDMNKISTEAKSEFANIKASVDADSQLIKTTIQDAGRQQQELVQSQKDMIEAAKARFTQVEADMQAKWTEVNTVVTAINTRVASVEAWYQTLNEAATLDAEELRKEMIKNKDGGKSGRQRDVSEYKVIANMIKLSLSSDTAQFRRI